MLASLSTTLIDLVTLARALELGHKPSVVFSLARETSDLFTRAGEEESGVITRCYCAFL